MVMAVNLAPCHANLNCARVCEAEDLRKSAAASGSSGSSRVVLEANQSPQKEELVVMDHYKESSESESDSA